MIAQLFADKAASYEFQADLARSEAERRWNAEQAKRANNIAQVLARSARDEDRDVSNMSPDDIEVMLAGRKIGGGL